MRRSAGDFFGHDQTGPAAAAITTSTGFRRSILPSLLLPIWPLGRFITRHRLAANIHLNLSAHNVASFRWSPNLATPVRLGECIPYDFDP